MDVAIEIGSEGADIVIENGDLRPDLGLRTAALVSIFCDARASDDEVAVDEDARGWWAEFAEEQWGSKLWLLARGKRLPSTLELAKGYTRDAFAWSTKDGVAQLVTSAASFGPAGELGVEVRLTRGQSRRWPSLWDGEADRTVELGGVVLHLLPG